MVVWSFGAKLLLLHACELVLVSSQKACDFVPPNDFHGGEAVPRVKCLSQKHLTAEVMNRPRKAAQFAPVLYFHPMEQYGLTDPAHYFTEAVVYDSNHKPNPQAISSPLSYLSILGNPEQDAIIKGAPLDANGISTSRVFFDAYPLPGQSNAWVYNYHLYYAWNGCSNMAMSTPSQRGGQSTLEFVACPYSVHEADWERVSIVVCPEDPQPDPTVEQQRGSESNAPPSAEKGRVRAAVVSQHNHDELIQCTGASSCEFENGHLLVYVGLNSHANFAHASNGTIYGGIRNDQKHYATSSSSSSSSGGGSEGDNGEMEKMEGVVMLDRTAKGSKWMPSLANLAPLPRKQSQDGGQSSAKQKGNKAAWGLLGSRPVGKRKGDGGKDEVIMGALAADEDAWAFYPGFWGTWAWRMSPSVTCFRPGLLQPAPCPPDSPAWHLLAQTLGLPAHQDVSAPPAKPILALPAEGTAPPVTESYHAKGGAKQGPNYRNWTGKWQPPQPTKLWHLPAHSLAYRLFANGNERLPVLRCLPGMGGVGGGVSKHVQVMGVLGVGRGRSGQGLVAEGASLPSELSETDALRGLSLMPQALKWAYAIEPFLCLAAIPAMLLVLVPWMLQVLQFARLVNEAEESGAVLRSGVCSSHRDARGPPHFMQRTGNGGGGGGDGSGGVMCSNGDGLGLTPKGHQSGGEQIQNTGQNSIAPLLGLVSLACGLCVVYDAQFYFSLMKASMPSACPLVDALRLFVSILVSILVVLDISCALRGLRGVISMLKSGKTGGSFRDSAWGGCWCVFQTCCKWWRVARGPVQQYTTYMLLGVVAFCVVAQASVQAANGLLSLLLPLHSASPSLGHIEFLAGQTSAPVLAIILFLRSLFDRWQLEARATLLVLPCFFFVVRHRCWPLM